MLTVTLPPIVVSIPYRLTPRQVEVMCLLAAGYSQKKIALELGIHKSTVYGHLKHAQMAMGAMSIAQMMTMAGALGIVKP